MSLIGISFALNMLLTRREAANFLNSARARYIAEAGIKRAVMDIRGQVASASYANLKTYISNYVATSGTNVSFGDGAYTLVITSEEDKVDINQVESSDTNQITKLLAFLTYRQIANLIDYRDADSANSVVSGIAGNIEGTPQCKNAPYDSIEEIRAATGINKATFDTNAQILTMSKPIIRGGLIGRYYKTLSGSTPNITIDTSPSSYMGKVVELGEFNEHYVEGSDGDYYNQVSGWLETHDCEFAGGYLVAVPASTNFGLNHFGVIWTGYLEIRPSDLGGGTLTKRIWLSSDDGGRVYINGTSVASYWVDVDESTVHFPNDTTAYGEYTFTHPGWYRIRVEFYDQTLQNAIRLTWTNSGGDFASSAVIPADRFGYDAPMDLSMPTSTDTYNSAGNYTITCTASVLESAIVVAQKKITAIAQVFGTWTQTTKAEWHAAMFGDYAAGVPAGYMKQDGSLPPSGGYDYRDGEARNVNWEDTCPLDATANLELGGYAAQNDSLKLGYWVDFDNDPAYTASMLKALVRSEKWGSDNWINIYDDNGAHDFFCISYGDFKPGFTGTDNKLVISTSWHESRRFEINPFYYFPSQLNNPSQVSGQPNVFVRAWTAVNDAPGSENRAYWKGTGTLYNEGWDSTGTTPNGPHVKVGIPVDGSGNEMVNTPYTGDTNNGYGFDANNDGMYQLGERICKVWPKGTHDWTISTNRIGIYNATDYDLNNEATSYDYWQPEIPFTTPMVYACGERMDSIITPGMPLMGGARGFGVLEKDNDTYWTPVTGMAGWSYLENNDMLELTLESANGGSPPYGTRVGYMGVDFLNPGTLAVVGNNGTYAGWVRGLKGGAPYNVLAGPVAATVSVNTPNFQFLTRNAYDVNGSGPNYEWTKWMVPNVVKGSKQLHRTGGSRDMYPADTANNTSVIMYFDNIRIIPASGFLVSTPFYAGENVKFGTVSWNPASEASGTGITIYARTSNDPNDFVADSFTNSYTNGSFLNSTANWIQYKTVLASTAFNPSGGYSGGVTPRLDDITITYLPAVRILYWKEG